jgi:hypothetical protein
VEAVVSSRPLRLLGIVTATVAAVVAVGALGATAEQDFTAMSIATLVVTGACVLLVLLRWGPDITRPPLLWLALFAFFHFGLVWTLGLLGEERVARVSSTALYWIHTPFLRPAVTVAAAGAVVFAVTVSALGPRARQPLAPLVLRPSEQLLSQRLGRGGLALQLTGVVILGLAIARGGGLALLSGGYLAFLESAQDALTGYGIWAVGLGSCMTQIGGDRVRHIGLGVFLAYAAIFFPLGLRGSVLFPACVLVATRSLVGRRAPAPLLLAAGLLALVGSAIVRTTRVGGSGPSAAEGILDGLVSTVTELGFSIRPTAEVLRWSDAGAEPSWFVSFYAVPLRLLESLTGWHGGPPVNDERLFNVKINNLVGAIGGSPVAEGYDAAGVLGVVAVLAAVGVALAWASRGPFETARRLAVFPVVVLPLTIAVRNSFAPVIPQVVLGIVVILLCSARSGGRDGRDGRGAGSRQLDSQPVGGTVRVG